MSSATLALELYQTRIEQAPFHYGGIALEAFVFTQKLNAIRDIARHLAKTMTRNLWSLNSGFKISEFAVFYSRYKLQLHHLIDQHPDLPKRVVVTPDQMSVTYRVAAERLNHLAMMVQFPQLCKILTDTSQNLLDQLNHQKIDYKKIISLITEQVHPQFNKSETFIHTTDVVIKQIFSDHSQRAHLSTDVFKDSKDVLSAIQWALKNNDILVQTSQCKPLIDRFDLQTAQIIKFLEHHKHDDIHEVVSHLYDVMILITKVFDRYGVIIHDMQRVDHNLKLALNQIYHIF